jgi:hypothetical protein
MVAHAIVLLACKQFVLLCFMYLVYSFNITLSWSAIMLLDSVLINCLWNCIYVCMSLLLCMSMYTWAYAFMLLDSVLINCICNCVLCMHEFAFMYVYVYMSLCFILMSMHTSYFALWCHVICVCQVILYFLCNSRFKSSLELMLCVIDISTLNKTYLIFDLKW